MVHLNNSTPTTYFHSEEMKRFFMSFNIKQTFSAPYHPQSNGKVERLMRTIKDMIDRNLTWVDSIVQTNVVAFIMNVVSTLMK